MGIIAATVSHGSFGLVECRRVRRCAEMPEFAAKKDKRVLLLAF